MYPHPLDFHLINPGLAASRIVLNVIIKLEKNCSTSSGLTFTIHHSKFVRLPDGRLKIY